MSIKSKVHTYGNEHESDWPPRFPENPKGMVGYIDKDTKEFVEGYPRENLSWRPNDGIICDSMPKTYHEAAGRFVESRQEWERLDKEHNTLTFGSVAEPRRHVEKGTKQQALELKRDRRRASEEALKMVRANPRHINQKWQKEAEKQEKAAKQIADNYGLHKQLKGII